jgi:hypothetical protein
MGDTMSNQIFPFEMPVGAHAKVVSPANYAEIGMVIRRDSETKWVRVDDPAPSWVWTRPAPGSSMLVELMENEPILSGPKSQK